MDGHKAEAVTPFFSDFKENGNTDEYCRVEWAPKHRKFLNFAFLMFGLVTE